MIKCAIKCKIVCTQGRGSVASAQDRALDHGRGQGGRGRGG